MHFLLLLRVVVGMLVPAWRDSLTLAVRTDGRIEHHPRRLELWERLAQWTDAESQCGAHWALLVRAESAPPRQPGAVRQRHTE